ncbi:MAG: hypothetical protein HY290_01670 [Planctomycetia bacterium]|nr:hypothetical protein [Planctomycetia bacterium]
MTPNDCVVARRGKVLMVRKRNASKKSAGETRRSQGRKKASANNPVKAKFTLRSPAGRAPRSPETIRKVVRRIVEKAESESGAKSQDVKIYPNIDSFSVSGSPELVESLEKHEEVACRLPEVSSEDMLIRPVRKRVVQLKSKGTRRSQK